MCDVGYNILRRKKKGGGGGGSGRGREGGFLFLSLSFFLYRGEGGRDRTVISGRVTSDADVRVYFAENPKASCSRSHHSPGLFASPTARESKLI